MLPCSGGSRNVDIQVAPWGGRAGNRALPPLEGRKQSKGKQVNLGVQAHCKSGFVTTLSPDTFREAHNGRSPVLKPAGGLWTSSFDRRNGSPWVWYAVPKGLLDSSFDLHLLEQEEDARILVVNNWGDLDYILDTYGEPDHHVSGFFHVNWDKLKEDYDAMHLTAYGAYVMHHIKWDRPKDRFMMDFNSWDVESTCWFRWKFEVKEVIRGVKYDTVENVLSFPEKERSKEVG